MAFLTGSFAFSVFHVNIGENSIVMIIRLLEKVFCSLYLCTSSLYLWSTSLRDRGSLSGEKRAISVPV